MLKAKKEILVIQKSSSRRGSILKAAVVSPYKAQTAPTLCNALYSVIECTLYTLCHLMTENE